MWRFKEMQNTFTITQQWYGTIIIVHTEKYFNNKMKNQLYTKSCRCFAVLGVNRLFAVLWLFCAEVLGNPDLLFLGLKCEYNFYLLFFCEYTVNHLVRTSLLLNEAETLSNIEMNRKRLLSTATEEHVYHNC